ncbi:MAG: histidine--tRNA ligase [Actinobacteria bacterium]|nr:histidine--tRNA ligase [Actinomycetota bacterium]
MTSDSSFRPVPPAAISGFPEWLPEIRQVEQSWLDVVRSSFELYGYTSVETSAVEQMDTLVSKGDTSKEVYGLRRLFASEDDTTDSRLGLHFDLTVPFARYVAQNFGKLDFPFKRYQMQKAWRGERPQEGRFREFTQCDIDVIDVDSVALRFDAELPRIACEILSAIGIGRFRMHINNRKVLQGFYEGIGAVDAMAVIRAVDKFDKIGVSGVANLLRDLDLDSSQVDKCLSLAQIRVADLSFVDEVRALDVKSDLLDAGLNELSFVMSELADVPDEQVEIVADLAIARGLDYYTGNVYEGKLVDFPTFPSIFSGGRYEDLAGSFIRRRLPGVGISLGITRIFSKLLAEGLIQPGLKTPTQVMVVLPAEEQRAATERVGNVLRRRGIRTEVYHEPDRIGKQLKYASRKGIPFVWFPPFHGDGVHEVKDMRTGAQEVVDVETWPITT